jgi:hypothetical protein
MRSDLEERIRLLERYTGEARLKARNLDQRIGFLDQWNYIVGNVANAGESVDRTGWIINTCCPAGVPPILYATDFGGKVQLDFTTNLYHGADVNVWTGVHQFTPVPSLSSSPGGPVPDPAPSHAANQHCEPPATTTTPVRYVLKCGFGSVWTLSAFYLGCGGNFVPVGFTGPPPSTNNSIADFDHVGNGDWFGGTTGTYVLLRVGSTGPAGGGTLCPTGMNMHFTMTGPLDTGGNNMVWGTNNGVDITDT